MKRISVFLLAIFVVISFCGCGHEHTWVEATCTEPKTCFSCGETEGEPIGHAWVDATCTESKICSICGETDGDPLGHDWIEATHTSPKTCSRCGATEGEPLLYDFSPSLDEYEFAEFSRFNSLASENGLGGTMVWLEGEYETVKTMDLPKVKLGLQMYIADLIDADGNKWYIQLDCNEFSEIEKYQELIGHKLLILAEYQGYSKVFEAPSLIIEKIYDRTTGSVIVPAYYALS